jgi:selenocysteine-specific elongation factor
VLTGIPITGAATTGDLLEVLPPGRRGRVRGVQAYHDAAAVAQAGQSSAVNMTDIAYREVRRGMVLASPGHFQSASMLEARFHYRSGSCNRIRADKWNG